jgi:CubicO group peptidase (beta-lactamase class C family)
LFEYDERVIKYWPDFGQHGKDKVTIRQLFAHQAGLFALDKRVDTRLEADFDRLAVLLARQKPVWEPGMYQAYHAITLGFYQSELLRRIDPKHRSLGRFFQEEIASPLGLDYYIGLPQDIPNNRLAKPYMVNPVGADIKLPVFLVISSVYPRSRISRALWGDLPEDKQYVYTRNVEVPSGGGIGTARSIARAYSVFATGGKELGIRDETIKQLIAPANPPIHGFNDEVLKVKIQLSLGFMKPSPEYPFAHPSSFGMIGFGGCFGFADPNARIGFAYVPNRIDFHLMDPRQNALRLAMYQSIGIKDPFLANNRGEISA